jgi:hypothetical protein
MNEAVGTKDFMHTLKVFYSDGISEIWQDLSDGDIRVFYNVGQQQYYSLPKQSEAYWEFASFDYLKTSSTNRYWLIGCILLLSFVQRYLYKS